VPSVLNYLAKFDAVQPRDFPFLKRLMWCGEVLPTPTLIHWMQRLPHVQFTNLYGPTEATVASSYYTVPGIPRSPTEAVPIGRPCDGEDLLVLNERREPVLAGEIGDLYIGGVGLSPGYWRDAEKTAQVFVRRPASDDPADRIYQTGDLARVDGDGLVCFLGRADTQIKSRGYRIELGEIEAALSAMEFLEDSAVVAIDTGDFENKAICCAYVPAANEDVTVARIRTQLANAVPKYMLPAHWMNFARLPKNANGKIDRNVLRDTFTGRPAAASDTVTNSAGV
jgi:acyl-coenzyme A synthetase/AMP-(fatty) acid ligase